MLFRSIDNKTLNTTSLASDAPGSLTAFSNRGVDFTNRAADINPDDIESLTVLKGPEASALYGIDAANGAIVITTKRGKPGIGGFEYNNSFRIESTNSRPSVQHVYGPTSLTGAALTSFQYFGAPYASGTTFYDNVDGFFKTALTQKHNMSFSGAAQDNRINYRMAFASTKQNGVVPNAALTQYNLTGASQYQATDWLRTDLTFTYTNSDNTQSFKGDAGPLIGLLLWPATDNAKDFLTAAGTRRRLTAAAAMRERRKGKSFMAERVIGRWVATAAMRFLRRGQSTRSAARGGVPRRTRISSAVGAGERGRVRGARAPRSRNQTPRNRFPPRRRRGSAGAARAGVSPRISRRRPATGSRLCPEPARRCGTNGTGGRCQRCG